MKKISMVLLSAMTLMLFGCGERVKYRTMDYSAVQVEVKKETAYKALSAALIDDGFDIKMSDQDIGIIHRLSVKS